VVEQRAAMWPRKSESFLGWGRRMSGIEHGDFGSVMAMAAVVRTMHQDRTSEEMLQSVVDVAAMSIPGFDRASISMVERRGRDSVKAASDDLVASSTCCSTRCMRVRASMPCEGPG
jgi:hypothetical protein